LFWLKVSDESVNHGEEGMVEQSISHHSGQKAEREKKLAFDFSPFYSIQVPAYGMVLPTFRLGLTPWLISFGNTITNTSRD
jgi:hypothetical protein